ncbi:glycosyltransferase [Candidatus Methylacidithermus pantelleriae]|nr:glycosyltransferase [Candidatus Methylacidithermus pantelleriae]
MSQLSFLLAAWGSAGDRSVFVELGQLLVQRGHRVTMVAQEDWGKEAQRRGLEFRGLPAGLSGEEDPLESVLQLAARGTSGSVYATVVRKLVLPVIEPAFHILLEEAARHDCLVAHPMALAAAFVWEKTRIPWATLCTSPAITPSSLLPPWPPRVRLARKRITRALYRSCWNALTCVASFLFDGEINRIRKRLGLAPRKHVLFSHRSTQRVLHLYSPTFFPRDPQWGPEHVLTGFPHPREPSGYSPPKDLAHWLAQHTPVWLFTLGSTVVKSFGRSFYEEAAEAVRGYPAAAILLIGEEGNRPARLPSNALAIPWLPHDWIMPRVSVVAHHCGMGTLASALLAGKPAVLCPCAFDQPYNAARLEELGVGKYLPRHRRKAAGLRLAMWETSTGMYARQAQIVSNKLQGEDGLGCAAIQLEELARTKRGPAQ